MSNTGPTLSHKLETENVFLFAPNLIGYARVILGVLSLLFMNSSPWTFFLLYSASCLLDALDGHAARYFNQTSRFGAVLDMVTDRSSTACLMVHLAVINPEYTFLLQLLIALDLSSHYMQMYASLTSGLESHKTVSESTPYLLKLYYTDRTVLFFVCLFNELFFILWYLIAHGQGGFVVYAFVVVSLPVCVFKQALNVVQLVGASQSLARADLDARRKAKGRE